MQTNGRPARERSALLVSASAAGLHDDEGQKRYPTLVDLLSPRFKDGVLTRIPGVVSLTWEGGHYKVTVRCEEEGLQCVATFETVVDLLKQLERHVSSQNAAWTMTYSAKKKLDTGK